MGVFYQEEPFCFKLTPYLQEELLMLLLSMTQISGDVNFCGQCVITADASPSRNDGKLFPFHSSGVWWTADGTTSGWNEMKKSQCLLTNPTYSYALNMVAVVWMVKVWCYHDNMEKSEKHNWFISKSNVPEIWLGWKQKILYSYNTTKKVS